MTAAGLHHRRRLRPSRMLAYVSFAVMVGGWLAFLVALIGSQATLDNVWEAVRDLPFVLEVGAWLVGFPFLLGLAIWHASWSEAARLAVIAVEALAYVFVFLPTSRPPSSA